MKNEIFSAQRVAYHHLTKTSWDLAPVGTPVVDQRGVQIALQRIIRGATVGDWSYNRFGKGFTLNFRVLLPENPGPTPEWLPVNRARFLEQKLDQLFTQVFGLPSKVEVTDASYDFGDEFTTYGVEVRSRGVSDFVNG